ncbi:MAG: hypothetical protein HS124_08330 [Anaerolineales bacterium]|nr:hypothetical protein [Anaerolineales bacterium]MCL4260062.1 hypothetical protein [Anaerolineales bacterium]
METASRTHRFLSADLYTAGYRVVGKVSVSAGGLYATVNDPTKSHIEVHDARLARIHMPTKLVDRFEAVRLIKTHIHALCVARREDLGPAAIVRGGYTNVASLPVRLTSSVYETEGKLEVMGRFDFAALVADATRNFVPLFDCLLTAILIPNLKMESPAVLFNWEHIDMMASLNQRVKEEK